MNSKNLLPALILFNTVSVTLCTAGTQDWPEFRGPTGQGISNARNAPVSWSLDSGVTWKLKLPGAGWSSPVMLDGKIALTVAKGDDKKVTLSVVQVDASTGKILWERKLFTPSEEEATTRHSKNGLASGTPIISDGVVYAHFGHMGTAALEFATGKVLWKQKIEYPPVHGTGSSPALIDGLLIYHADGKEDPAIIALHADTGKLAWRTKREQEVKKKFSFSTPLMIENQGHKEIISQASGMVGAYAPENGELLWKVRYGEGYSVVPRPLYANGLLYIATGFNKANLMAIRPDGANGDVTDSHVVWTESKGIPKTASFVAAHSNIYILDDVGTFSCRDAMTGELKWMEKLKGNFSSSPVMVGNTLYCMTEDGVCFVFKVSSTGSELVSEIDMEERIFASPIVVDDALYIRTEEHLWKIGG